MAKKKNPKGFVQQHPWMTFFLAAFAISGAVTVLTK